MNKIQQIDETPLRWKVFGVLTVVGTFVVTMWGLPIPFTWNGQEFWLLPPVGAELGITDHPSFGAAIVITSPLFLFVGVYVGFVWREILGPGSSKKEDIDDA